MSYYGNILEEASSNEFFRKTLFTGAKSQLVVMHIPPGGEVGEEIHDHVEQALFFLSGTGIAELDGKSFLVGPGDAVVVTPGTKHNFKNTGTQPLKIYTVYAPPNHLEGTVHKTKEEADRDEKDETFGHAQG